MSCACPPDRRRQSPRRRCCSPTRPGTALRARLPPHQCLLASEKGSSAAGQGFLPPAAFLRVTEPGMYPECQVKRAPGGRSLGRDVAPPLGPAAPIGEHAPLAPPPLRGRGYAHVAAVHPAAPHGRAPAFADPADREEQD